MAKTDGRLLLAEPSEMPVERVGGRLLLAEPLRVTAEGPKVALVCSKFVLAWSKAVLLGS